MKYRALELEFGPGNANNVNVDGEYFPCERAIVRAGIHVPDMCIRVELHYLHGYSISPPYHVVGWVRDLAEVTPHALDLTIGPLAWDIHGTLDGVPIYGEWAQITTERDRCVVELDYRTSNVFTQDAFPAIHRLRGELISPPDATQPTDQPVEDKAA